MGLCVRASNELGLSVIVFDGIVTPADFEVIGELVADPKLALLPMALVDMCRAVRIELPSESIRSQARRASRNIDDQIGPGARMAFVGGNDESFGVSRMYELLRCGSPVEFAVFRSLAEAEAWLDLPEGYEAELSDVF